MNFVRHYLTPIIIGCFIFGLSIFLGLKWLEQQQSYAKSLEVNPHDLNDSVATVIQPEFIDLTPIINDWLESYSHGQVSIAIYDFDHDRLAGTYNADRKMLPASLYKLFYVYDGYTEISAGRDDPNQPYLGSLTLGQCLDKMIRESHNPCAEAMLEDSPRAKRVANLIKTENMTNTIPTALQTSAQDVLKLLQMYYVHTNWSAESWQTFRDSAINQPPTSAGDFRSGLPSGFKVATVLNKVGWSSAGGAWDIYNDATLLEFPESTDTDGNIISSQHYASVIMTRSTSNFAIAQFGEMIENAILSRSTEVKTIVQPATNSESTSLEVESLSQ